MEKEGWAEHGNARLESVLDSEANPNIIRLGYTALHLALLNSPHIDPKPPTWIAMLLKYGANPNLKNKDGLYASHQMVGLLQHRAYTSDGTYLSSNLPICFSSATNFYPMAPG